MEMRIRNLSATLALNGSGQLHVLDNISFDVDHRQFVAVVGPSGCGKSTLFNVLSGIVTPTAGTIEIDGQEIADRQGATSYMPQDNALMPWRRVIDNAILGLEIEGVKRPDARSRARELVGLFGLDGFEDAHVWQLSGGMKQRVALMRTLLLRREIVMLDEPFGALDSLTRSVMQSWLLRVWDEFQSIFLFVTHDIEEAIVLADRVLVMSARPARLLADIAVDIPRPRPRDFVEGSEFLRLRRAISALLHEESLTALRQQHDNLMVEGVSPA